MMFSDKKLHDPQTWLEALIQVLPQCKQAVLVLANEQLVFMPAASWRADGDAPLDAHLMQVCEQTLSQGQVLSKTVSAGIVWSMPLVANDNNILGVLGVQLNSPSLPDYFPHIANLAVGWLQSSEKANQQQSHLVERLVHTLNLVISALSAPSYITAAQRIVTEMSIILGCDRISFGLREKRSARFVALSHNTEAIHQVGLVQQIEKAMDEAIDQGIVIRHGWPQAQDLFIAKEHEALVKIGGNSCVLSVPFLTDDGQSGAIVYEWVNASFEQRMLELAEVLPTIVGKLLVEKKVRHAPVFRRCLDSTKDQLSKLFGPNHLTRKITTVGLVSLALFFTFASGQHNVTADVILRGEIQRDIVAPFDGFIAKAPVRAGEQVAQGETLFQLDDRELLLERARWQSQQLQFTKQVHDAQAQQELAQMQIAMAQALQAKAQQELASSNIERANVVAPFAGVIVSGDLSQRLGAAVEKGELLFQLAPLDEYRVILNVDERDIGYLDVGYQGVIVLHAFPEQKYPIVISKITPVAETKEGINYFRIEATLTEQSDRLRPGMEGIGKIDIAERNLLWIWTHKFQHWLTIKLWTWFGV